MNGVPYVQRGCIAGAHVDSHQGISNIQLRKWQVIFYELLCPDETRRRAVH